MTGEMQREAWAVLAGVIGVAEISPGAMADQIRRGSATGVGCAGQGIDRRKHTRSKRQEAINESTQYTGFIRRLGDGRSLEKRRKGEDTMLAEMHNGWKKFEGEVAKEVEVGRGSSR